VIEFLQCEPEVPIPRTLCMSVCLSVCVPLCRAINPAAQQNVSSSLKVITHCHALNKQPATVRNVFIFLFLFASQKETKTFINKTIAFKFEEWSSPRIQRLAYMFGIWNCSILHQRNRIAKTCSCLEYTHIFFFQMCALLFTYFTDLDIYLLVRGSISGQPCLQGYKYGDLLLHVGGWAWGLHHPVNRNFLRIFKGKNLRRSQGSFIGL
jgi:hypothetical protein